MREAEDQAGMRWPFKGGTERMRGAGRSRAGWAAGGQGTQPVAAGPWGGRGGPSFAEPRGCDLPVGSAFAGFSPGVSAARARPGFVTRQQLHPPAVAARGCGLTLPTPRSFLHP
jgi:hypothetical protein